MKKIFFAVIAFTCLNKINAQKPQILNPFVKKSHPQVIPRKPKNIELYKSNITASHLFIPGSIKPLNEHYQLGTLEQDNMPVLIPYTNLVKIPNVFERKNELYNMPNAWKQDSKDSIGIKK